MSDGDPIVNCSSCSGPSPDGAVCQTCRERPSGPFIRDDEMDRLFGPPATPPNGSASAPPPRSMPPDEPAAMWGRWVELVARIPEEAWDEPATPPDEGQPCDGYLPDESTISPSDLRFMCRCGWGWQLHRTAHGGPTRSQRAVLEAAQDRWLAEEYQQREGDRDVVT